MTDTRALPRLLDELVWTLRREGLAVAPSQVLDLERAVLALGWDDRFAVCEATAAVVLQRPQDGPRLRASFASFFARSQPSQNLWDRLRARGFTDAELDALRDLLRAMADAAPAAGEGDARFRAFLERGAGGGPSARARRGPPRDGRAWQPASGRLLHPASAVALGLHHARARLAALRQNLRGALGARGDHLADALAVELDRAADTIRDHVHRSLRRREDDAVARRRDQKRDEMPFTSLSDAEVEVVCRAVRCSPSGSAGPRASRRATRKGKDRSHRAAPYVRLLKTGGVPFGRSESARTARSLGSCFSATSAIPSVPRRRFMLELVYAAHELFDRTRSFVFVSELGETTTLFEREPPTRGARGRPTVAPSSRVNDNSNYGRVLRAFEARHLAEVDRRTTVVILGDGRTNYHDASEETLARIRAPREGRLLVLFRAPGRAGRAGTARCAFMRRSARRSSR